MDHSETLKIVPGRSIQRLTLYRILLGIMLSFVLLTPFLQIDSLDQFPVTTDDFELQVTCCFSIVGMLLVFARIMKLVPSALRQWLAELPHAEPRLVFVAALPAFGLPLPSRPLPLRI